MTRKEFVALAVGLGACCCGGATALAQSAGTTTPEVQELKRKIEFMQKRMAKLVRALDEPTRQKMIETMGRECAKDSGGSLMNRFRGKPEEYLAEARRQWHENATYDKEKGTLRVVGPAKPCGCAFVKVGLTPPEFCNCTLGYNKEFYSAIFGEPVDVEIEDTFLRGADHCAMKISRRK